MTRLCIPGTSSLPPSLLPSNILTIFSASFHVRNGNQIDFQYPPPSTLVDVGGESKVDLTGVEWKVLPSGGHLIEKDTIYFSIDGDVGVSVFRNVKMQSEERGARMISVGLVLKCKDKTPTGQQLAIVPHLDNLEHLAERLVTNPGHIGPLKAYYDSYRAKDEPTMSARAMRSLRLRRRRDPKNGPHDPTSHLSSICASLGPLVPVLLKKLMVKGHRMLIFTSSPPLIHAARIGYNLADLVQSATPVTVKCQVGVHDITFLQNEQRGEESWVAWTTDKILLEKKGLFDSVLDMGEGKLLKVEGKELKPQKWTTREFATFNELDAQAERHVEKAVVFASHKRRRLEEEQHRRRSDNDSQAMLQWRSRTPRTRGGLLSTILTFLRYWLAGWWFLPSHWRYGLPATYVLPLGIRGDGGVRSSIILLPDSSGESSDDEAVSSQDEDPTPTGETGTSSTSCSDDEHFTGPPDPLLAAVGVSIGRRSVDDASSRRSSFSHHSTDEFLLADSLFTVWNRWTNALVIGLTEMLEDAQHVTISSKQMASLGLSAATEGDVQLVESLAGKRATVAQVSPILRWFL